VTGHPAAAPPIRAMTSRRFKLIELHFVARPLRVDLQNIELAGVSQEVLERFYNL
jgi:hypothetical protein